MKKIYILIYSLLQLVGIVNAQYNKLLDFAGTSNGSNPSGDLLLDGKFLYGMTGFGGSNTSCSPYGCGVIFKISTNGTGYSKLHDFASGPDGSFPQGSLIYDGAFLYGMTKRGGANGNGFGTIFKIKPDGTGYFKLLDFAGANGRNPTGSLISDGTFFYGMTAHGGTNSCDQYGTGCGVIFKIKPDGTGYSKLHDFVNTNGGSPSGSLVSDGTFLYGVTRQGGSNNSCMNPRGCGVIFRIKPDGSDYSVLYNFDGLTGGAFGSLISDGTFLYGMTTGSIFKIKSDGTDYIKLLDFTGLNGTSAYGSLLSDGAFLYGMAGGGGTNNEGVIFKIKEDGTGYTKLFEFDGINGIGPQGSLILSGNVLYGMTQAGGINNMGVVFSYRLGGSLDVSASENKFILDIYPNPASKEVTLNFSSSIKSEFLLSVKNSLGQTVYSEKKKDFTGEYFNTINLSRQPAGVYFLEVLHGEKRIVKKLALQ